MKVIIRRGFDLEDYRARLKIEGMTRTLSFLDGSIENNNLGRNFSDCYSIGKLVKEANELGLKGEAIEIEEIEDNDIFGDNYE